MYDLRYDPEVCAKCKTVDCLMKCDYTAYTLAQAKEQKKLLLAGEDAQILHDCVTCYACEEYCPNDNHPFYLLVERQEQLDKGLVPVPITNQQLGMMAPKESFPPGPLHDPVINMCFFPMLTDMLRGDLFEGTSYFVGSDVFCNVMWLHTAGNSVIRERLPRVIDKIWTQHLEPNGIEEIVCYHDECYGTYTYLAQAFGIEVPWKSKHLFQYLYERLSQLKDKITPLGATVAYQRPCSNRFCPETAHFVDDIFELIGVNYPERQYDRGHALCCGSVIRLQQREKLADDVLKRNLDDMKAVGAEYCVFNCPACLMGMGYDVYEAGVVPIMMSELCQMALGEKPILGG